MDTSAGPAALETRQPGGLNPGAVGLRSRGELPVVFDFHNGFEGVHTSRTMMLADLKCFLSAVPPEADRDDFWRAIVKENALEKRTVRTRRKATKLLRHLYALDPNVPMFRAIWFFWQKDPLGRPLLAPLCIATRDPVLRQTSDRVLSIASDEGVVMADLANAITQAARAHFAPTTLRTTDQNGQNTASTRPQSEHLWGRPMKRRVPAVATPPWRRMRCCCWGDWMVQALERRRGVGQKRVASPEFPDTQFSYTIGQDGGEKFVVTPELRSENEVGTDPLPPCQVWTIGPGTLDEHPGLYRVKVNVGPGSGVKILPAPAACVRRKHPLRRAKPLQPRAGVGGRPRSPRPRVFRAASCVRRLPQRRRLKPGRPVGPLRRPAAKERRGRRGCGRRAEPGRVDRPGPQRRRDCELAIDKGATALLMPVTARKHLFNLPDDLATRIDIQFYLDAKEALVKSLAD